MPRALYGESLGHARHGGPTTYAAYAEIVPDGIPPAVPWEELERKTKRAIPAKVRAIRGKLNVPRERFRVNKDGGYVQALPPWAS